LGSWKEGTRGAGLLGAAGYEGKGVGMKPWRGYHGFGKLGEGKREIIGKRE